MTRELKPYELAKDVICLDTYVEQYVQKHYLPLEVTEEDDGDFMLFSPQDEVCNDVGVADEFEILLDFDFNMDEETDD
jgi:hypothetical protein